MRVYGFTMGVVIIGSSCMLVAGASCLLNSSGLGGPGGSGGTGGGPDAGTGGTTISSSSSSSSGGTGGMGGTTTSSSSSSSSGGTGGTGGTTTTSSSSSSGGTGGTGGAGGSSGGPQCGDSGAVVFNAVVMPCFKAGIDRAGNFLPPPDSSDNTSVCEPGGCANTPVNGDLEILWVDETAHNGRFTSVKTPVAYNGHCLPAYTAASPPTMDELKVALTMGSGWFTPVVNINGTDYTLSPPVATPCANESVIYEMQYGP